MKKEENLFRYVLSLADDAVVLGHRLSEWCSNGSFLEEDIALTNTALDYIGRARLLYQYAAELEGKGRTEDDLAYLRDERGFTNLLLHELPNGDFAFTMVRQYILDAFYSLYLGEMLYSKDTQLAAIAAKAIKETRYHLKRSETWIEQLAEGSDESRERVITGLENIKDFVGELFEQNTWESELAKIGIAVDRASLQKTWDQQVQGFLKQWDLKFTDSVIQIRGGRDGIHTEHLGHMLSDMQYVQRSYPGLQW